VEETENQMNKDNRSVPEAHLKGLQEYSRNCYALVTDIEEWMDWLKEQDGTAVNARNFATMSVDLN
jgi:hypothetical protein